MSESQTVLPFEGQKIWKARIKGDDRIELDVQALSWFEARDNAAKIVNKSKWEIEILVEGVWL